MTNKQATDIIWICLGSLLLIYCVVVIGTACVRAYESRVDLQATAAIMDGIDTYKAQVDSIRGK